MQLSMKTFYFLSVLVSTVLSQNLAADSLANLELREYKLHDSPAPECEKTIRPQIQNVEGRKVLVLTANIRMIWENRSSPTGEKLDCDEVYSQTVNDKTATGVFETHMECKRGDYAGSERDTISLRDKRIFFRYEPLMKSGGKWIVNPARSGYTCEWR